MTEFTSTGVSGGNRSRERMKHEVVCLRETVAVLEAQLTALRAASNTPVSSDKNATAAWQDIAERQRQQRYEAEVENSKLRGFLQEQIRLRKTLEKLLHRRQHAEVESLLGRRLDTTLRDGRTRTTSLVDSEMVARELKATLPALVTTAHAVFENECFTNEAGPFRSINVRFRDESGTFVESAERRLLPFDQHVVSDALLQQFDSFSARLTAVQEQRIWGECIEYDLSLLVDTTRFRGVSRTKLLVQRVAAQSCTYMLYAGISDLSESLGVAGDGLCVRHRGWTRLCAQPTTTASDIDRDAPSPLTEYASYHIATPAIGDNVSDRNQRRTVATLTDYVLATIGLQMDMPRERRQLPPRPRDQSHDGRFNWRCTAVRVPTRSNLTARSIVV